MRAWTEHGGTDERPHATAPWRNAPYRTGTERTTPALTREATGDATGDATGLNDRPDSVPDPIWDKAADLLDEGPFTAVMMTIPLDLTTRQPAGATR
ncbi:hypothetical protein [Streptomyces sp. NPDC020965]|uniref:hypothetical protein n=1 Tax=Streptomyces sp. NPDC020965 TaxID=3365105 RepID=UPI0037A01217